MQLAVEVQSIDKSWVWCVLVNILLCLCDTLQLSEILTWSVPQASLIINNTIDQNQCNCTKDVSEVSIPKKIDLRNISFPTL